jgi:hypothetical protein
MIKNGIFYSHYQFSSVSSVVDLKAIQHVDQQPQPSVIAAVEGERDARQRQQLGLAGFFRQRFDFGNFSLSVGH